MVPRRMSANGVPWLLWLDRGRWECEGCGGSGPRPAFDSVAGFARWAGDLKRSHAACRPVPEAAAPPGGLGHPLNPDRAER